MQITGIQAAMVASSSLTATSVDISWTQPDFSLPVVEYRILLTRVTGNGQALCTGSRPAVTTTDTSMSFTGLEEFSTYTVTITAKFNPFGELILAMSSRSFTTLSVGKSEQIIKPIIIQFLLIVAPTGSPRDVTPSMTSRSIMVTWDTIECIERNGIITGYTVVFQEQGGADVPGDVVDMTFTAGDLTPYTSYLFQVAGVNDVGTGPFTDIIIITTDEEGSYNYTVVIDRYNC